MKGKDRNERPTNDINSTNAKAITNFHDLCERISKLDSRIAGALVMAKGKIIATSNGAGAVSPSDEYLSKLIQQAEIMVGIPLANNLFFGDFNFTLVSYERLDSILFYIKTQRVVLGVGVLPPYDMSVVVGKIRKFLRDYYLHGQMHTMA